MREDEDGDPFRLPKRALAIASAACTLALAFLVVSLLISSLQVRWSVGQARTSYEGGVLTVSLPINVSNAGYYDLTWLSIHTVVLDSRGPLLNATSTIPAVKSGGVACFEHNISVDLASFFAARNDYLFNSATLEMVERISLTVGGLIPVSLTMNHSATWGAPLEGFNVAVPEVIALNSTHVEVHSSVSFFNAAQFPVEGVLVLTAYNGTQPISSVSYQISVPSEHSFNEEISITIPALPARFTVGLVTPLFTLEVPING